MNKRIRTPASDRVFCDRRLQYMDIGKQELIEIANFFYKQLEAVNKQTDEANGKES